MTTACPVSESEASGTDNSRLLWEGGWPKSTSCRLVNFCARVGTSSGPYLRGEVSCEEAALSGVFVAFRSASAERGNGLNRSPSPTEKHRQAMTPTRMVVRPKQDLVVLHSLLVIYTGNNTRMVVCHDTQDCTVCDRNRASMSSSRSWTNGGKWALPNSLKWTVNTF